MPHVRVRDAAQYLGVSKSLLDKARMGTEGPAYFKVGRAVIYSTDDLDVWLEAKRRSSTWAVNDNAAKSPALGPNKSHPLTAESIAEVHRRNIEQLRAA